MNRLRLLLLLLLLLSLPSFVAPAADAVQTARPNILFLVADDLATRLGCYGDAAAITPNLDRLAGEGVVFRRAYCQGVVCTPSRTSFMLGLDNVHAGPRHFRDHPETMTLARWMREHGYQTFSVGKVDHAESYVDPKAWDIRVNDSELEPIPSAVARVERRSRLVEDLGPEQRLVADIGISETGEAFPDRARTERALRFLREERDPERPFFAAVGFHSPHRPNFASRAAWDRHDPAKFTLETLPADATPLPAGALPHKPGLAVSEARQREAMRGYYAAVTTLDEEIGRLIEHLRASGLLENTVVVFTADHGHHLGWRGQWRKHHVDEQVLHVPLIVRRPRGARGANAGGIVELLDLFPTFCDIAALPAPPGLDGKSFLPLLENPAAEGKLAAFCDTRDGRTVRTLRWRYTERPDGSAELYDHATDPSEYHNVLVKPEHAAEITRLQSLLAAELGPRPEPIAKGRARRGEADADDEGDEED